MARPKNARKRTKDWVGPVPYGIGQVRPNHYLEMARIAWENKDRPRYAWKILRDGVCDGCALGTTGLRDFTMDGIHLCNVRLNLLRLNTMPMMDHDLLGNVDGVAKHTSRELRDLGRMGYPMVWRAGRPGYARISWDLALSMLGSTLRATDPQRMAFYLTSRGITNEVYYVAGKVARFLGTNNIDNAARLCHAASTVAMRETLGVAASTCSYKDWIGADLIVFFGSDVANNQPVTTKYLFYAKKQGTSIAVVNPFREPGMMRYWVPSVVESALFGTKLCDEYVSVSTGGDLAFLNGVLKALVETGGVDSAFVDAHTTGFDDAVAALDDWPALERASGVSRAGMESFAALLVANPNTIFVWSMGLTQHRHGVDTVKALINVALARGLIGRAHSGVMPIRGHSGVQGGAEVGCVPNWRLAEGVWSFNVPDPPGLTAAEQIDAAGRGALDLLWSAGGNFLETLPEPATVRAALATVPHRVHQDIVVTSQMLVPPKEWALILPARTRYEQIGGGTETTTEREIIYSPEIPGPRPGEARSEWQIFMQAAEAAWPERAHHIHFDSGEQIRAEIARAVPFYAGIERLRKKGDHVQWGGRILCEDGEFPTPDRRARFSAVRPPEQTLRADQFLLSTRRGKQFNSMVHKDRDPLTGAVRDDVLMAAADAAALGVSEGEQVVLRSAVGTLRATVKVSPIKERNVQVHWPECQVLLQRGQLDPQCGVPDYNAVVTIEPVRS